MDIVQQLRMYPYEFARKAAAEIERLRERCNPSTVVMIGDTGHYVSDAVAAEISRLQKHVARDADAYWDARESLVARIEVLHGENAKLREDAARLDFLERSREGVYVCVHEEWCCTTDGTDRRERMTVFDGWGCGMIIAEEQPTVRAAIDAAMRKTPNDKHNRTPDQGVPG